MSMAGISRQGEFREKISSFLKKKLELLEKEYGTDSNEYQAIYLQYKKQDFENEEQTEDNRRHWEADLSIDSDHHIRGVERLYTQSAVIEPTMICAAHCRYCLRANYEIFTLSDEEIIAIAQYCGSHNVREELREVLVTGGDPFIVPKKLKHLVESLIKYAPNIKLVRIGTRLPLHDPFRIDDNIYEIFKRNGDKVQFEIATQINHEIELFPEVIEVFKRLQSLGLKVYSQNVLLKNVNDNIEALTRLYKKMRDLDIEAHYLFHSVPMRGMHHFRTTVLRGLELAMQLVNSGKISGRVKPMYALMTDVGKVTLYEGTILKKDNDNYLLVQTSYKYEDRIKLNPNWILPANAMIDENGYLLVRYLDGNDN